MTGGGAVPPEPARGWACFGWVGQDGRVLTVCRWCAEEILVPIVGARGYCSWACQDTDPASGVDDVVRPVCCQPPATRTTHPTDPPAVPAPRSGGSRSRVRRGRPAR